MRSISTATRTASESIEDVLEPENESIFDEPIDTIKEKVKEKDRNSGFNEPKGITAGIETEMSLVNDNLEPASENERDEVVGEDIEEPPVNAEHELGASQIEIESDPVENLEDLDELYNALKQPEEAVRRSAREKNMKLVRHGTNTAVDLEDVERTDKVKYQLVPDKFGEMRIDSEIDESFGMIDEVDPRNEDIPAAICATQTNVQAKSLDDAVEKANIGYAVAPYVTALTGNSRIIDGKDLGFNDARVELWSKAFDIGEYEKDETDIGKLDEYIEDFDDYVERIKRQPKIMNDDEAPEEVQKGAEQEAFDVGQGMYWKDSRIKVVDEDEIMDNIIVEYRQNSTQLSTEEDIAVSSFYIGRVAYEQEISDNNGLLEDIGKVNENRENAMKHGMDGEFYDWKGDEDRGNKDILREELDKAREGLNEIGIDDPQYLDLLYDRLDSGVTPSDEVAEAYQDKLETYDIIDDQVKREAATEAVLNTHSTKIEAAH